MWYFKFADVIEVASRNYVIIVFMENLNLDKMPLLKIYWWLRLGIRATDYTEDKAKQVKDQINQMTKGNENNVDEMAAGVKKVIDDMAAGLKGNISELEARIRYIVFVNF